MADKFEKFTERARKVFSLAQEEAQRFNHNYIGTEHLLLGLVREGDGIAARVLANLGVQLPKVRSAVEFIIGRGDGLVVGDPGLTPRAKKVIELAMDEARRLNNHYIGTEHLLLGLVREGEGIAAEMLESLGVSLEKVRQQVMQVASSSSPYQQPSSQQPPRQQQVAMPGESPSFYLAPSLGELGYSLKLPAEEMGRLVGIARELNRPFDDLIREAVRRIWLGEETVQAVERGADTYYTLKVPRREFDRLVQLSARLNRSPDDLVREALHRWWLAEEGEAGETPPPPAPPPQAGEGSS